MREMTETAKGEWGGECNRGACHNPNATWYNQSTRKHYCTPCAELLNRTHRFAAAELYGTSLCIASATPAREAETVGRLFEASLFRDSDSNTTPPHASRGVEDRVERWVVQTGNLRLAIHPNTGSVAHYLDPVGANLLRETLDDMRPYDGPHRCCRLVELRPDEEIMESSEVGQAADAIEKLTSENKALRRYLDQRASGTDPLTTQLRQRVEELELQSSSRRPSAHHQEVDDNG
jgi:hypothetical protein